MKDRPNGFLSEEHISHDSEIFDYIAELHGYLWRFVRTIHPAAGGSLRKWLDTALKEAEGKTDGD